MSDEFHNDLAVESRDARRCPACGWDPEIDDDEEDWL